MHGNGPLGHVSIVTARELRAEACEQFAATINPDPSLRRRTKLGKTNARLGNLNLNICRVANSYWKVHGLPELLDDEPLDDGEERYSTLPHCSVSLSIQSSIL
jgi:hypothetical protein